MVTNIILNNKIDNTKSSGKTIYNSLGINDTTVINKESFKTKLNFTNNISEYKDNSEETNPIIDNILVSYNKYSTLYEKISLKLNLIVLHLLKKINQQHQFIPTMKYYNFVNKNFYGNDLYMK